MLVLSRKPGEKIIIKTPAGDIIVTFNRIHNREARLGFEMNQDIRVYREEVYMEMQKEGGT